MADIRDRAQVVAALDGCDACVHAAAAVSLLPSYSSAARQVTVGGTDTLLRATDVVGRQRIIHIGSASSFGFGTKSRPGTEESAYRGRRYRLGYADYKDAAQQVAARHAANGSPVVLVTPTFMLGPLDTHLGGSRLVLQVARAPRVGFRSVIPCPPGGRNFVAVSDVADGICRALELGEPGRAYLLGHRNLRYTELMATIGEVIGLATYTFALPRNLMRAVGAVGSATGVASRRTPRISVAVAGAACDDHYYSAARAVRELVLPQTPLERAIEASWRWLQDSYG